MKLDDIGFYTLTEQRAEAASSISPLWRCELILTSRCNLNCKYCRRLRKDINPDIGLLKFIEVLRIWMDGGLRNVRFSGGEPTLYPDIGRLVDYCVEGGVERIAISTNGTASLRLYDDLLARGVNDFSISLDSGCCSIGDKMAGKNGAWETAVASIRHLTPLTYVTVGMVFTDDNIEECIDAVKFVHGLGVADIRIIPAAQQNRVLTQLCALPQDVLDAHPILHYRILNAQESVPVRGLNREDSHKCWLALDDIATAGGYHFPCVIYLREQGDYIGKMSDTVRMDRAKWISHHDTHMDKICKANCLDVCRDYNNRYEQLRNYLINLQEV